jgi:hypothetical protein
MCWSGCRWVGLDRLAESPSFYDDQRCATMQARVASDGNLSSFKAGEPPQGQCARSWKDFPPHDLAHDPAKEVLSLEKVTKESMDCATIPLFLAREIVRYEGVIQGDVTLYRCPSRLRQNVRARAVLECKGNG